MEAAATAPVAATATALVAVAAVTSPSGRRRRRPSRPLLPRPPPPPPSRPPPPPPRPPPPRRPRRARKNSRFSSASFSSCVFECFPKVGWVAGRCSESLQRSRTAGDLVLVLGPADPGASAGVQAGGQVTQGQREVLVQAEVRGSGAESGEGGLPNGSAR